MKIVRWALQIIAILLQLYFVVETVRLHVCGYVIYMGEPIKSEWFSMLFTLLVVIACEVVSLVDAILLVITEKSRYSFIYLTLFSVNAICFLTMAYISTVGTIICLSLYAVLFVFRIVNLVPSIKNMIKMLSATISSNQKIE